MNIQAKFVLKLFFNTSLSLAETSVLELSQGLDLSQGVSDVCIASELSHYWTDSNQLSQEINYRLLFHVQIQN